MVFITAPARSYGQRNGQAQIRESKQPAVRELLPIELWLDPVYFRSPGHLGSLCNYVF